MICWNRSSGNDVSRSTISTGTLQGPTLADSTGEKRLQKLLDSRKNLQDQIDSMQDQLSIIDGEILDLLPIEPEIQTPVLDMVIPVAWRGIE